jgi:hypothetical protein
MKRIFISGPYTIGDVAINVRNAMNVANELIDLGFAPFCPHLTHFLHINNPQEYEKWLEIDMSFLEVCHALIRLPGISDGADKEVECALKLGIPVYNSIGDLIEDFL